MGAVVLSLQQPEQCMAIHGWFGDIWREKGKRKQTRWDLQRTRDHGYELTRKGRVRGFGRNGLLFLYR